MNYFSKEELRRQAMQCRASISAERRDEASSHAFRDVPLNIPLQGYILSYVPFHSELDISKINISLAHSGRLVLPKVTKNGLELFFVEDLATLETSLWGISEPDIQHCKKIKEEEIVAALIPGLYFDSKHYRLGYGKGFYDRLLPQLTASTNMGIGFHEQNIEYLPCDPWDHPLHQVLLF